jgi:hypothetical protein
VPGQAILKVPGTGVMMILCLACPGVVLGPTVEIWQAVRLRLKATPGQIMTSALS